MSRFVSVLAVGIFVVALSLNFIFSGPGGSGSDGSDGASGTGNVGDPGKAGNPAGGDFIGPEDIEVPDQPGGGVPVGEVDIRIKEGRTNGQREFAREFAGAAYGEAGDDYLGAVSEYVRVESFERSAGWGRIRDGSEESGDTGGSAAILVEYEISDGQALGMTVPVSKFGRFTEQGTLDSLDLESASLGELVYAVGDGYDESVDGEPEDYPDPSVLLSEPVRFYSQSLVLAPVLNPDGGDQPWTILAASEPVQVTNPNVDAPAPSDKKVGEPGGNNGGEGHSHGGGHEH